MNMNMNMNMNIFDFREIEFGMTDAQSEGKRFPNLLTSGYLEIMNLIDEALLPGRYVFLGYKGSGKSALSAHLKLTYKQTDGYFINEIMMKAFPYKLFSKVVKGDAEQEAKYPLAWRWILLLYILHSFDEDKAITGCDPTEWQNTINILQQYKLFPINSISELVNKTSKRTFKINLKIFEYSTEVENINTSENDISLLVGHLENLLKSIRTDNQHYLIIDGLDDYLSTRDSQNYAIISLINESKDLNDWLIEHGINFKIIVLCRKDIFDRLSDPNKNKIRQDYSFFINWFDESETDDYKKSNLIELANLRGRLTYPEIEDVFSELFPAYYEGKSIYQALLEYTRHTPRDFLCLLKYIKKACTGKMVTDRDISRGIKSYSSEYFIGEIRDELAGYIKSAEELNNIFSLLSDFRKREFKLSELEEFASQKDSFKNLDLVRILSVLFDCSAIGHIKENLHYIKYRNPNMTFSVNETIIIHKGLWRGL